MRVLVALSGGVDSSVAAALLQQQGYEVIGVTLRLYACEDGVSERSCCGLSGVAEARAVAGHLGIPHYVVDGQELFERRVLRNAWQSYDEGQTPNPCVACNEWLKFGLLYEQARKFGAEYVATGHHARVEHTESGPRLFRGHDAEKDQSYFLFSLSPEQLRASLLPVGKLDKQTVRELAHSWGLPNAARRESQDACIAQRGDLAEALRQRFGANSRPGAIVDPQGKVLGKHKGIHHFTIGQRKGLETAVGRRIYVTAIDAEKAEVVVGDDGDLGATALDARDVNWLGSVHGDTERSIECEAQIRYRHKAVAAIVERMPDQEARVRFRTPERAVTPGQAVVFYRGAEVVGGGWIARAS